MKTPTLKLLRHAMQAYTMRAQALADNLANLDTPGYRRETIRFETELQARRRNVPSLRTPEEVQPRYATEDRPAQLEDELMSLADTQMRTQLTTRALREHFELLRTGITGRAG